MSQGQQRWQGAGGFSYPLAEDSRPQPGTRAPAVPMSSLQNSPWKVSPCSGGRAVITRCPLCYQVLNPGVPQK